MRKILLISLAAVIVAGGIALVTYAEDAGGPPRFQRRRGDRPDAEGERRGPPRSQLTEEQRADLAKLMEEKVAKDLMKALADFQKAVKKIVGDDERAVRMATFRAIMRQMRPPEDRERGDRDRPDRRPARRRRPPGGPPPPE